MVLPQVWVDVEPQKKEWEIISNSGNLEQNRLELGC